MSSRDRRALLLLGVAVALFLLLQTDFLAPASGGGSSAPSGDEVSALEQQLRLTRERARLKPLHEVELGAARDRLESLETRLLESKDPALAQAEMRSLVGDLLSQEGVDLASSRFGAVELEQGLYARAPIEVEFTCGSDQLVNLLAAIADAERLLTTRDIVIRPGNPEVKSLRVRMTVAGYLPLERAPELAEEAAKSARNSAGRESRP